MEDSWGIFYESDNSDIDCCYNFNIPNYLHDMDLKDQINWYYAKKKGKKFKNQINIQDEMLIYKNTFTNISNKYFKKILINCNISKFRIRFDSCCKYVEYLINIKVKNNLYGKWIRYSDLINIKLDNYEYWETIKTRNFLKFNCPFYRHLNINYLYKKCYLIESYISQFLYDSNNLEYFIDSLLGKNSFKLISDINKNSKMI